jgi:hypothetical protein
MQDGRTAMPARRWIVLLLTLTLVGAATLSWLPEIVRRVAIARIHALTGRPVAIDAVALNPSRGA